MVFQQLQLEIGIPIILPEKKDDKDLEENRGYCIIDLSTDDANKSVIEEEYVVGK